MLPTLYHLTQIQEFVDVLPSGRWSRTYMLPGTTLSVIPGHETARDVAPWGLCVRVRVWAAPLFYDLRPGEVAQDETQEGPGYVHWSGWVYLPVEAVGVGAWVAK